MKIVDVAVKKVYRFNCPNCQSRLEADSQDLEDIGGKSFWIDLRLQQLRQTPGFDKLQGIIFGEFSDCAIIDKEDGSPDEIIDTFCQNLTIPVIKHFPYGHIPARHILPVGLPVKLNADDCSVRF